MSEPVRLVIWDLDETFWRGTVTEGGISYLRHNHDIVVTLAQRGIMSSICSKNDYGEIKAILQREDLWNYFIFPSINWESKGPRIKALIEDVQLRAASAMFIDDNPINIEEAKYYVPDLQVRSDSFICEILASPLFVGKNDRSLTRLTQYKSLERRKVDSASAGPDPRDFLRSSNIRVRLEFDVEKHLDRMVELINRTNQLNFTKIRLPEDAVIARAELVTLLSRYAVQAALVHVSDRYGDHGYCGLYIHRSEARRLDHFCFSCRILGMGVERWLYDKLGRPNITVVGEVLTDLFEGTASVDWINAEFGLETIERHAIPNLGHIVARGGCDLGAVVHYFTATVPAAVGEYHEFRFGTFYRIDHSIFLRYALDGISGDALTAAVQLGFKASDFRSEIFAASSGQAVVLSFNTDGLFQLYRHRQTGLRIPIVPPGTWEHHDATAINIDLVPEAHRSVWRARLEVLASQYDQEGLIGEAEFKETLRDVLNKMPRSTRTFILKTIENPAPPARFQLLNAWINEVAADFPTVTVLRMDDFVAHSSEVQDYLHFDRRVYHRIYQGIIAHLQTVSSSPVKEAMPA